jgi:DNA-binding NtrC family response regulator
MVKKFIWALDREANIRKARELLSATRRPTLNGSTLAEWERHLILTALVREGGSTSAAAERLGCSTRKIQLKLHEYARLSRAVYGS